MSNKYQLAEEIPHTDDPTICPCFRCSMERMFRDQFSIIINAEEKQAIQDILNRIEIIENETEAAIIEKLQKALGRHLVES